MSGFYLDTPSNLSDDESVSRQDSDDDFDNLPYPQPLLRSAFLTPNFKPAEYLSTLRNRHQTLADLRQELRTRNQTLAKELLDLVNNEYQAFLGLGSDLRGGEDKVETVRVGVLGFVKGVDGVKANVVERKNAVGKLVEERERITREMQVGRQIVEVHTRIGELEDALAVTTKTAEEEASDEDSEDEEDEEEGQDLVGMARLERLILNYLIVTQMIEQIGSAHPLLVKQSERLVRIRNTLLSDLGTALKQAKAAGARGKVKLLKSMSLFGELDEPKEAIKILKEGAKKS